MKKHARYIPLVLATVLLITCAFLIGKDIATISGDEQQSGYYPYPVYPWMYWTDTPEPVDDVGDEPPPSNCACPPCCRPAPPKPMPTAFPYPYPIP